jgi:hypothetical protein
VSHLCLAWPLTFISNGVTICAIYLSELDCKKKKMRGADLFKLIQQLSFFLNTYLLLENKS